MKPGHIIFILLNFISFAGLSQQSKYDSLQILIKGASVSVYKSRTLNYYLEKKDTLYLLPPRTKKKVINDGTEMVTETTTYRNILNYHLHNCKEIGSYVQRLYLNDDDLIKLFKRYYSCVNESYDYDRSKDFIKRTSFRAGLNSGLHFSQLKMDGEGDLGKISFGKSNGLMLGLSYELFFSRPNLGIGGQFNFIKYNFDGDYDYAVGSTDVTNDFKISYSSIQKKFFVKKFFGKNNFKPFVKAGPTLNFNRAFYQEWIRTESSPGGDFTDKIKDIFTPAPTIVTLHLGVGIERKLVERLFFSIEFTYDDRNTINKANQESKNLAFRAYTSQFILLYKINS
jgi:hypothetical protein